MQGQDAALSMSNDTKQQLDSADLVGLKDGVIVTPTLSSNDNMIVLCIKCPSLHEASSAESNILTVPSHFSIGQIKRRIESTWPGRPQAQGMRIFRSGQLLTDEMVIDDVVPPVSVYDLGNLICQWTDQADYDAFSIRAIDPNLLLFISSSVLPPGQSLDLPCRLVHQIPKRLVARPALILPGWQPIRQKRHFLPHRCDDLLFLFLPCIFQPSHIGQTG